MSFWDFFNPLKALLAPLTTITGQLADAKVALAAEGNSERRIASQERISVLEARRDILLSEQGHWSTRMIRPAFAFPFVIYLNKVILFDKVFPTLFKGKTDPLGADLTQIMMIIIAAYFVDTVVQKLTGRKS